MKKFVDNFSNPSFGDMAVFAPTASAKNLMPSVAPVLGQAYMNVHNVNGNLRLPPKRRCTAPSYRYGSGC
jgi:hypothetical protein